MSRLFTVLALLALTLGGCGVDWFPAPKTSTGTTSSGVTNVASFAFTNISGVAPNTLKTSNAITVTLSAGSSAPISVSGGSYSKDNGASYTTTASTVKTGDKVTVQHTTASGDGQSVSTTLTIGNQTAVFTSTTARPSVASFAFTNISGATVSTLQKSNAITVSVTGSAVPISVVNGEYSTDNGVNFVVADGTVANGAKVVVQHTASANAGETNVTTLTIGTKSATFASTTTRVTTGFTVSDFSFTPKTDVVAGSTQTSNTITVGGLPATTPATTVPISITGTSGSVSTYSIDGGPATAAPATIGNGQTVTVSHTAGSGNGKTVVSTLLIGNKSAVFSSTTALATVADFAFDPAAVTVAASSAQKSSEITVSLTSGTSAPISVSGGSYAINTGAFTTAPGNVVNGDKVTVQNTASATAGGSVTTTLSIGNKSATFTINTTPSTTPIYNYSFTLASGTGAGSIAVSKPVVAPVSGAINITDGEYSLDNGTFTSAPGTVTAGQIITVRHKNSNSIGQTVNTILTIGTWNALFSTVVT